MKIANASRGGWLCLLCGLFLLSGCMPQDDRDLCCDYNTARFRYLYRGGDHFDDYIHAVRYLLFDGEGRYLRDMAPREDDLKRVPIGALRPGSYTLVCLGNFNGYGEPFGEETGGLSALRMRVERMADPGASPRAFGNGDPLYWGELGFSIEPGSDPNNFVGETSNIHCLLHLRVEWEGVPAYSDGYRFRLEGVGTGMALNGAGADTIDVHAFPPVEGYGGEMELAVPLRRLALQADLYTLRWTNRDIPVFRLMRGDTAVTRPVDLRRAFRQWGWNPDETAVQEYSVRMLIRADGTIELSRWLQVGVADWVEGGNFS